MENSTEPLETLLRRAPAPKPPADLKAKLLQNARTRAVAEPESGFVPDRLRSDVSTGLTGGGWRRWLLLLVPTGVAAAMATVVLVQQDEIRDVREELRQRDIAAAAAAAAPDPDDASRREALTLPDERSEIARLRELVAKLEADAVAMAQLEAENARLQAAIIAARASLPAEIRAMSEASDRPRSIQCVNNLKQMGLAVRIYATDNSDENPPDILSMTNELTSPKLLVCPSDSGRAVAETWAEYSSANLSYEFLSPGPGKHEQEPNRVLFRCPIHGHIGLCDGSVQMGIAKNNPEWLVPRNGALYLEGRPEPTAAPRPQHQETGGAGPAAWQSGRPVYGMSPDLARRYGLVPVIDADGNMIGVDDSGNIVPNEAHEVEAEPQP